MEKFCENLEKTNFSISRACESVGIGRTTYYDWMGHEGTFKAMVDETFEKRGDIVEARALEIASGEAEEASAGMVQFLLKTKFRNRGYKEVQELSVDGGLNFTMPDNFKGAYKKNDEEKS